MKIKYMWLSALVCPLFLFSCYEDEGNYDYKKINEVSISGLSNQTKYTNIDRLTVTPDVQFALDPNGQYEYLWVARSLSQRDEERDPMDYVLGKEKNLDYFIDLEAGKYIVTLTVTDVNASLKWTGSFNLTVSSSTYMGWMVLCDDNGYARLDMLEESGDTPLHSRNILANTPLTPKRDPWKMAFLSTDLGSSYDILMLTGDGCSRLIDSDLSWEESNDFPYMMADPSLGNMKVENIASYAMKGTLMIGDQNAYWRQVGGGALFTLPVNNVNGKRVSLSPYIGVQMNSATGFGQGANFVLFDKENDCFLRYGVNDNKCSILNNFPKGYKLKYMQNTVYNQGVSYAILYDEANAKYWMLSFYASDLQMIKLIELNIPNIENIDFFAFDQNYQYLFYADGNQIYLYAWTEDKPENLITPMVNYPDERITMLKYNPTIIGGAYGTGIYYPDNCLIVGTATESNQGTLHLLEPQPSRGITTELKSETGFPVIVDATYRERV